MYFKLQKKKKNSTGRKKKRMPASCFSPSRPELALPISEPADTSRCTVLEGTQSQGQRHLTHAGGGVGGGWGPGGIEGRLGNIQMWLSLRVDPLV